MCERDRDEDRGRACVSVCTKGCVIYLPNVRLSDNATPVSRLAVIVAVVTLANRCHRSAFFFLLVLP